jgi:hypothetical protein
MRSAEGERVEGQGSSPVHVNRRGSKCESRVAVGIANGGKPKCIGLCLGLTMKLQGFQFKADVYILPLGCCEIVASSDGPGPDD